jgi:uroporphyrinogen-III synthase
VNVTKTVLYLGLTPPKALQEKSDIHLIHFPIIEIIPYPPSHPNLQNAFAQLQQYTHLLFTSKSAVTLFFDYLLLFNIPLHSTQIISIGKATTALLETYGVQVHLTAQRESSEGVVDALKTIPLDKTHFFWPHSALSRTVITDFFHEKQITYTDCPLYHTVIKKQDHTPDLNTIDEIIFTSPSTVDAFLTLFKTLPEDKTLTPIGETTDQYLKSILLKFSFFSPLSQ